MNSSELQSIAHLARLKLSDAEITHYAKKLTEVLNYVSQINAISTDLIEPMSQPVSLDLLLREDQVTEVNQKDLFLSGAPESHRDCFVVPTVIE